MKILVSPTAAELGALTPTTPADTSPTQDTMDTSCFFISTSWAISESMAASLRHAKLASNRDESSTNGVPAPLLVNQLPSARAYSPDPANEKHVVEGLRLVAHSSLEIAALNSCPLP